MPTGCPLHQGMPWVCSLCGRSPGLILHLHIVATGSSSENGTAGGTGLRTCVKANTLVVVRIFHNLRLPCQVSHVLSTFSQL